MTIELQDITATAVQAGDTAFGARSGSVVRVTLGTAAGSASGDFATAAQGALAATAVQPAREITAGTGLSGGGDLSADRSFALADTAVTAGSYGGASAVATFTVDAQGRLTAAGSTAIAIAAGAVSGLATVATTGAYGDLSGVPGDFAGSGSGLVPAPGAGDAARYLRADGAWADIPSGGSVAYADLTSIPAAIDAIDGLTPAADRLAYYTGAGTAALATITAAGRALIDDADAAAQRTTLGLGTIATQAANSVTITGGAISGITDLAVADGGTGASTAAGARTNLGLGDAATKGVTGADANAVTGTAGAAGRLASWNADGDAVDAGETVESVRNFVGVNAQTGTTYTLVLADQGKLVTMANASPNTLTIPANASVAFAVGTIIAVCQKGAGATTIEGATGVTVNGVSAGSGAINTQWQSVSLMKIATDEWIASGDIATVA